MLDPRAALAAALAVIALESAACSNKASAGPAGSTSSAAPSGSAPAPIASDGRKMGNAKLTFERANGVYKGVSDLKNTAALAAKVDEMKAKLGPADRAEGDKSFWYAVDSAGHCFEFAASPTEGAGFTAVPDDRCGL
jgi:hypothetical protein